MAFPPLGNSDHVVVSVSIDFPINSKQDTLFHRMAYDYSCADNRCKKVLEAAKLAYATKTKESITSQKLAFRDFW